MEGADSGLTITRRLATWMGGRIWVESEMAKGSIFNFTVRLGVDGRDGEAGRRHW